MIGQRDQMRNLLQSSFLDFIVDMLAYAIDNQAPAVIVLISGDTDFAYALAILRLRGYEVIVIAPSTARRCLKAQANRFFDWQDVLNEAVDIAGAEDMRDNDDGLPQTASPSSTLAEQLRVPPSARGETSNHTTRNSSPRSTLETALSCSPEAPRQWRDASSQTDVQTLLARETRGIQYSVSSWYTTSSERKRSTPSPIPGTTSPNRDTFAVDLQLERGVDARSSVAGTNSGAAWSASGYLAAPETPPNDVKSRSLSMPPPALAGSLSYPIPFQPTTGHSLASLDITPTRAVQDEDMPLSYDPFDSTTTPQAQPSSPLAFRSNIDMSDDAGSEALSAKFSALSQSESSPSPSDIEDAARNRYKLLVEIFKEAIPRCGSPRVEYWSIVLAFRNRDPQLEACNKVGATQLTQYIEFAKRDGIIVRSGSTDGLEWLELHPSLYEEDIGHLRLPVSPSNSTMPLRKSPDIPVPVLADVTPAASTANHITPPSKPHPKSPDVLNPRPSVQSVASTSRTTAPSKPRPKTPDVFGPLLSILRSSSSERVSFSQLGSALLKRFPNAYKGAGVSRLSAYLKLAEKAGIIRLGGLNTPGGEWVESVTTVA